MNIKIGKISRLLTFALAAIAATGAATAYAVPVYNVTDLGTLGGVRSWGVGINDNRQVMGWSWTSGQTVVHTFIGDATGITDLGSLAGGQTFGEAINNNGQVAGASEVSGGVVHAFVTDAATGGLTDLGTLVSGNSEGTGINDSGQVAVTAATVGSKAFVGDASGLTALGTLFGGGGITTNNVHGINNNGQVVGEASTITGGGELHAFIGDTANGLTDLGTLGGLQSFGNGINNNGQVTGSSDVLGGGRHAFIGDSTNGLTDIGTLGGASNAVGKGINDSGQVVGRSGDLFTNNSFASAFLWDSGVMYDLENLINVNDSLFGNITLFEAAGINNNGDIIATGFTTNFRNGDQFHAILLTAQRTSSVGTNSVPEPAPLALLGLGLLGLGLVRRRRR